MFQNAQFLSDVGGAIGLWIGLSMLSMFEIIQLLVELCHFVCYKCNHDNENGNKSESKNKNAKNSERSYKPQNKDGFHRQSFNQDMNDIQKNNGRNSNFRWPSGHSAITANTDPFVHGEQYLPETQYSNFGDYQHIGEYYMYKGKQNI